LNGQQILEFDKTSFTANNQKLAPEALSLGGSLALHTLTGAEVKSGPKTS